MGYLNGKVAIVTGGVGRIGAGIARCLIAEGATVAILDLDHALSEKTATELGSGSIGIGADSSEETQMTAAAAEVVERLGGLDIMVNTAGGAGTDPEEMGTGAPFSNVTQRGWDFQLQSNLRTTFAGCKAAIPHIEARGGGAIINFSSIAGVLAMPGIPAYAAAKAGVISLTKSLALELGASKIRVNAICPGMVWTAGWERLAAMMAEGKPEFKGMEPRDIFLDYVVKNTPMGREQTPDDFGQLITFLAGPGGANITGNVIKLDGGITLQCMPI